MKILACIDMSPLSEVVATEAAKIAGWTGAALELVHVVRCDHAPDVDRLVPPPDLEYRIEYLGNLAARLREGGRTVTSQVHLTGVAVATFVVDETVRAGASLVVIGSHNRGRAFELFVGSVTQGVIGAASVPVVVVNGLRTAGGPG